MTGICSRTDRSIRVRSQHFRVPQGFGRGPISN